MRPLSVISMGHGAEANGEDGVSCPEEGSTCWYGASARSTSSSAACARIEGSANDAARMTGRTRIVAKTLESLLIAGPPALSQCYSARTGGHHENQRR